MRKKQQLTIATLAASLACTPQLVCAQWLFGGSNKNAKEETSPIKVNIQETDAVLADNLKAYLPSLRHLNCTTSADRIERFVEAAKTKLQQGAEAVGYFDAKFTMTTPQVNNCWVLNVAVEAGSPVRVVKQDINVSGAGAKLEAFQALKDTPPYALGDELVQQHYEDFKTELNRQSNQLGFFDADYKTHELQVDPDKLEAAVMIDYDTGERYRVSDVQVKQDVLNAKTLAHYLQVRPGDYYDSEKLLKQQQLLDSSGYYKDVKIVTQRDKATNQQIPVAITAERRKRYTYTGKVGYGSDTKWRVEVNNNTHWVNSSGHKLSIKALASNPESELGFSYKVPLWQPEHEFVALSGGWQHSKTDSIESHSLKGEFSYNRRSDSNWQQAAFLSTLYETTQVPETAKVISQLTLLGARVSKTYSDDTLFPTFGWQFSFEMQGAVKGLLSDQSILQTKASGKYIKTLDSGSKLIAQGSVAKTFNEDLAEMPKSLRYFAGGQNSVRGYNYQSLGTKDSNENVIGGKNLLTGSIEYERPIVDKWSAAAFVDAGNAFESWKSYSTKVGIGTGVRYKSPLGPIRADLAVPKDDLSDIHFYFSLGPDL